MIDYSWPLLTVILSSRVSRFRLSVLNLLGLGVGFWAAPCCCAKTQPPEWRFLPGYLCAFAAALIWAAYSAFAARLQAVPAGAMAGFYAATALLAAIAHLLFETTVSVDAGSLAGIAALGLGPMGLAFFLWDYGVKRGDPRLLGTLGYGSPVLSYLLLCAGGYALFGPATVMAAGLVMLGGIMAVRKPI